jgi:ceramide glucosyltransferase
MNQEYPDYEVIYGILDENDPACGLVRNLLKDRSRASLYTGSNIEGANNKVKILHTLAHYAQGEVLVIADADTRVDPDCLQKVCKPFSAPSVGIVTCM